MIRTSLHGLLVMVWLTQAAAPPQTSVLPAIELEKTRFLQGERIFLWLNTFRATGDDRPIPAALLGSRRVIYTRPDGTTRIDQPSAPIDGMGINAPGDMGFRGGWTLREDSPQLGRWSVVYEVGGRQSAPAAFAVEAPELFKIEAFFEFSTQLVNSPEATAALVVRNRSPEALRFVALGQNHSIVWGRLRGPGMDSGFAVSPDVLTAATGYRPIPMSVDRLDWETVERFPNVTVAPGATWRLSIPLAPWLARESRGLGAELDLSTELQILIGQRDGEWGGFSPVRIIAAGSTKTGTLVK